MIQDFHQEGILTTKVLGHLYGRTRQAVLGSHKSCNNNNSNSSNNNKNNTKTIIKRIKRKDGDRYI